MATHCVTKRHEETAAAAVGVEGGGDGGRSQKQLLQIDFKRIYKSYAS